MKQKSPLKKLLILLLNFVLSFVILRGIIELSKQTGLISIYYAGTAIFGIAIVALFIGYFVLNGFTFNKEPLTYEELSDKLTEDEKADFLAKQPERKEKAKKLLLFLLPLILTFALSYIELYLIG